MLREDCGGPPASLAPHFGVRYTQILGLDWTIVFIMEFTWI